MSAPQFTPGPWRLRTINRAAGQPCGFDVLYPEAADEPDVAIASVYTPNGNARLIAAAPDHADIGWAMCVAAGRWAPWGDERGEFVLNGISFATKLDPFGVPEVTHPLRVAIAKARGDA